MPKIPLELDPKSVLQALAAINSGLQDLEGQNDKANDKLKAGFESVSTILVHYADRQRAAHESLTKSIERQAEAYGKTGEERLLARRDAIIKRLGDEKDLVDRVTSAYEKMVLVESRRGESGGIREIGKQSEEARASLALLGEDIGVRIPRHLRSFVTELPGVGAALNAAFSGVALGTFGLVISEGIEKVAKLREELEKLREMPERLSAEFGRMHLETKLSNDELSLTNAKLDQSIAKLEHRPGDGIKTAIMEARVEAEKLADTMDKSLQSFQKILQENRVGFLGTFVGHSAGSKDIEDLVGGKTGYGGMRGELLRALSAGEDPTAVLDKYQKQTLGMLAKAEYSQAAQQGKVTRPVPALGPAEMVLNQGGRIEELQSLLGYIGETRRGIGLDKEHESLDKRNETLKTNAEASNKQLEILKQITHYHDEMLVRIAGEQGWLEKETATFHEHLGLVGELTSAQEKHKQVLISQFDYRNLVYQMQKKQIDEIADELPKLTEDITRLGTEGHLNNLRQGIRTPTEQMALGVGAGAVGPRPDWQPSAKDYEDRTRLQLGIEEQRIRLMSGPGNELDTAQKIYGVKLQEIELDRRKEVSDAKKLENAQQLDAINEANFRAETKRMEAQAQMEDAALERHKRFADEASGLYHTLFTHPSQFGPQLANTVREAALKPVTQGLGNLTANLLLGGGGGSQEARSTDLNTLATQANTAALMAHASIMTGTTQQPYFGASSPLSSGSTVTYEGASSPGAFGFPSGGGFGGGGFGELNLGRLLGAPGGTTGFNGPVGGFNARSLGASWGNLKGSLGIGTDLRLDPNAADPTLVGGTSFGSVATSQLVSQGAIAGGSMLAMRGLMGKDEGTGAGIGMGALGGGLVGFGIGNEIVPGIGGLIGAGVGAAAGALAGVGEMLAGVQSPVHEVESLVKRRYGIGIEDTEANKIVALAQSRYGGNYSVAVSSPEVRQMLGLYAAGTGQNSKFPVSATTPMGGGLEMQGGKLMQSADYLYGNRYSYASNLSVAGGVPGQSIPTPGPVNLTLSVGDKGAADFLAGNVVTSDYVQAQWSSAAQSSNGRVNNSAMLTDPGLLVS